MADTKISALAELAVPPAVDDELIVVDKSDTTMAGSGTDKRIKAQNLLPNVSLEEYLAVGDDSADDTTAITNALAAIPSGGKVYGVPGKVYKTSGGHTLPKNAWLEDIWFHHTGNNVCLTHDGQDAVNTYSDGANMSGLSNVRFYGNTGAAAGGLEVRNSIHFHLRNVIFGHPITTSLRYSGTSGFGLKVNNVEYWNENLHLENVHSFYNQTGIALLSSGATPRASMSYHRWRGVACNVAANQVGIDFGYGGANAIAWYYANVDINIWLQGNSAIGLWVRDGCIIDQRTYMVIRGETLSAPTGHNWLKNEGTFRPRGFRNFDIGAPQAGADLTGADATEFAGLDGYERSQRLAALGVLAESFPLEAAHSTGLATAQKLVLCAIYFQAGTPITGLALPITSAAVNVSYARAAIYDQAGGGSSLLANSNDLSSTFNSAGATKVQCPFSSVYTIPVDGLYRMGFLFDGTTMPTVVRAAPGVATNLLPVSGSGALRLFSVQAGQASLPAGLTAGNAANGDAWAFQVY